MKNPRVNPEIEAIKQRLLGEYLPEGGIPNSRVAKQIELLSATATLEYAKRQNRPVRRAKSFECQFTQELQEKQQTKDSGFIDAFAVAVILDVTTISVRKFAKQGRFSVTRKAGKMFFDRKEIEDYRSKHGPFYLN